MEDSTFSGYVSYSELRTNFARSIVYGLLGTLVAAWLNLNPMLMIAPPIIAMVLYFLWFKSATKLESHVEQFADSFYYLGFLFTLGALAIAMIPWAFDAKAIQAETVVSKLGIALLTTIIGLGGRVFLTQFSATEADAIADIQQQLREGSRSLAAELDLIVDQFVDIKVKTGEHIESLVNNAAKMMGASFEEVGKSLEKSLKSFDEMLLAASIGLTKAATTTNKLGEQIVQLTGVLETFEQQLLSTKSSTNEYEAKLSNTAKVLQSLAEGAAATNSQLRQLGQASAAVENFSSTLTNVTKAIQTMQQNLANSSKELQLATEAAQAEGRDLTQRREQHKKTLEQSVAMIEELQDTLTDAVEITSHKLDSK